MPPRFDVAVVGGGIVGLAVALAAAKRGRSVVLFERGAKATGASVRNFGMVWPVGQPPGELHRLAMTSRDIWREVAPEAGFWFAECGSVHAVRDDLEARVLREFADRAPPLGIGCELLEPAEALRRFPALNPDGLRAALWSPTECAVDPREAVAKLPNYLSARHGVDCRFGATVVAAEDGRVRTAAGDVVEAGETFVCGGADFETLFPDVWAASGVRRCKLQMLAAPPQPGGWRLGPHVAGGLTLGHYAAFGICPSLPAMKARHAERFPDHGRLGVHIMASQNELGEVVIGDSHDYDAPLDPFDRPDVDALILDYLRTMVRLPDWTVARRWHGVYAKPSAGPLFTATPRPGVRVIGSPGGAGMTLAFGVAEKILSG